MKLMQAFETLLVTPPNIFTPRPVFLASRHWCDTEHIMIINVVNDSDLEVIVACNC